MEKKKQQQQSVLITGCSDGSIGAALATSFAQCGLHVFASSRSLSSMSSLSSTPSVTLLELDVTSDASVGKAVQSIQAATDGKLDYLVNNSGALYTAPVLDTDIAKAQRMFEVNLWGVFRVTQAFVPLLIAAKGTVVNNGSAAALVPICYQAAYGASKAALHKASDILRLELRPFGVDVRAIYTGTVGSRILDKQQDWQLPQGSLYDREPFTAGIAKRVRAGGFGNSDVDSYARSVVGDILGGTHGDIYRGKYASLARWLPGWLSNYITNNGFGLD